MREDGSRQMQTLSNPAGALGAPQQTFSATAAGQALNRFTSLSGTM
jgi:hypothetical protein